MSRTLRPQEIDAVLALSGPDRYEHFVKRVVDWGEAWGLWDQGWAVLGDSEGQELVPLWPHRVYAELCRNARWERFEPRPISTDALVAEFLPGLTAAGRGVAVFPTPAGKSVSPGVEFLVQSLVREIARYED